MEKMLGGCFRFGVGEVVKRLGELKVNREHGTVIKKYLINSIVD